MCVSLCLCGVVAARCLVRAGESEPLKILKPKDEHSEAAKLAGWLEEGVFDAVDKKCLRSVSRPHRQGGTRVCVSCAVSCGRMDGCGGAVR